MSITFSGVRLSGNIVLPRAAGGSGGDTPITINGFTTFALMNGSNTRTYIRSVTYNNGKFVAVGYNATGYYPVYATSTDGSTWTTPAPMNGSTTRGYMQAVTYNSGKFVAVGYDNAMSPIYATSTDGSTWTTPAQIPTGGSTYYVDTSSVASGGGKFVAVGTGYDSGYGYTGGAYTTSTDGSTWARTAPFDNPGVFTVNSVAYGSGKFVATGYGRYTAYAMYATSTDGTTWTTPTPMPSGSLAYAAMFSVTYGGGKFVAVGYGPGQKPVYATSTDGSTWTAPANISDSYNIMTSVAYSGGKFVAVGYTSGSRPVYTISSDGSTWTTPAPMTEGYTATSAAGGGGKFVIVGYDGYDYNNGRNYGPAYSVSN